MFALLLRSVVLGFYSTINTNISHINTGPRHAKLSLTGGTTSPLLHVWMYECGLVVSRKFPGQRRSYNWTSAQQTSGNIFVQKCFPSCCWGLWPRCIVRSRITTTSWRTPSSTPSTMPRAPGLQAGTFTPPPATTSSGLWWEFIHLLISSCPRSRTSSKDRTPKFQTPLIHAPTGPIVLQ